MIYPFDSEETEEKDNPNNFGMIVFVLILAFLTFSAIYQHATYEPQYRIVELYNESFCVQRDSCPFWHQWKSIRCFDELKDAKEFLEYYKSRVNGTDIKRIIQYEK